MTIGMEQDLDPWPGGADLAHKTAEKATHLPPRGPTRRAQQGGDGAALAVEHDDRLEAVCVVLGVGQPQLLAAVGSIEGVVDVEGDTAWHLAEAGVVEPDHGLAHAQQVTRPGQVLEPRDGRLRA